MADKNFLRKLMEKAVARPQAQCPAPILHLTAPRLLASALIVLCAVAWAFFMGFMVGRGQSPAEEIHAMTGMLEPAISPPQQPEADLPPANTAILDTPTDRKPVPVKPDSTANSTFAAATTAALPVAIASAQTTSPRPAPPPAKPVHPKSAAPRAAAQKSAQNEPQFDYTFQISAVKSQNDAIRLTKQLAAKGVKASVSKSGKVWLVLVSVRGGAADAQKLSDTAQTLKLGKPLRLSRKPVQPPAPKRGRNK